MTGPGVARVDLKSTWVAVAAGGASGPCLVCITLTSLVTQHRGLCSQSPAAPYRPCVHSGAQEAWAQKQEALLAFPPALGQTICITVWPGGAPPCSLNLCFCQRSPAPVGGVWGLRLCDLCCHSLRALLPLPASVLTSKASVNPALAEVVQ